MIQTLADEQRALSELSESRSGRRRRRKTRHSFVSSDPERPLTDRVRALAARVDRFDAEVVAARGGFVETKGVVVVDVLDALGAIDGVTFAKVGREVDLSAADVGRFLLAMEREGLVTIERTRGSKGHEIRRVRRTA